MAVLFVTYAFCCNLDLMQIRFRCRYRKCSAAFCGGESSDAYKGELFYARKRRRHMNVSPGARRALVSFTVSKGSLARAGGNSRRAQAM